MGVGVYVCYVMHGSMCVCGGGKCVLPLPPHTHSFQVCLCVNVWQHTRMHFHIPQTLLYKTLKAGFSECYCAVTFSF